MAILFAFSAAFFAGITAILAKIGVKNINSNLATAIRTTVIVIFAWILVFLTKGYTSQVTIKSLIFLILSGIATGLSWLCYFRALQIGDINKVTPIDKSSTVLSIILAFLLLGEKVNEFKIIGIILITIGTYMMITKSEKNVVKESKMWLVYAILSAIFASLTTILAKIGITEIESNYGTAIRTLVVLIMAWIIVFFQKKQREIKKINIKTFIFLILSGITTGLSWLSYYRALQMEDASKIAPIDKLSIIVTILFSYFVFKEKLSKKSFIGLIGIVIGTLLMIVQK